MFDGPKVCTVTHPTARKTHTCVECHRDIKPGETYERTSGIWDAGWCTFKTCSDCEAWRDELLDEWTYGLVREHITETYAHYPGPGYERPSDGRWDYHNGYGRAA